MTETQIYTAPELYGSKLTGHAQMLFAYTVNKALRSGFTKTRAYAKGVWELVQAGYSKNEKTGVWERREEQTMTLKMKKVSKLEDDKRQVFGFFSVVEVGGMPVVDLQGDVITVEDIEKAAYRYMQFSRMGDDRHDERCKAVLIESMVFTKEKQQALGIDLGMVGWWGGFKVIDNGLWENFKSGKYEGFSIGGRGHREQFGA